MGLELQSARLNCAMGCLVTLRKATRLAGDLRDTLTTWLRHVAAPSHHSLLHVALAKLKRKITQRLSARLHRHCLVVREAMILRLYTCMLCERPGVCCQAAIRARHMPVNFSNLVNTPRLLHTKRSCQLWAVRKNAAAGL